ncbi:MAG: NAD(P)-binding domain-containing protein [Chlorobi bacterium]|nr:NAD(P)-binding domain-containing protein [Chlorobiota bacterium]
MEVLLENIVIYGSVGIIFFTILFLYLRKQKKDSDVVEAKIKKAKEMGLHEPVSLHPVVDINSCIKSGACITACPEKDILGIKDGKATTINASRCVGHGACFHACPVGAISLKIGTETRGVELPHVSPVFESNVPGIYIAGEMGGMGLIKNAVEQGKQAVLNIAKNIKSNNKGNLDLVIVGAGPAGISASLMAKKNKLKFVTLEQDTLGGTVYSFPRAKIVMTAPMELPLYGKIKLVETSKDELISIWKGVLDANDIVIQENTKVESVGKNGELFEVITKDKQYLAKAVLLAIGRRGSPRKLGVEGEQLPKVYYRLLDPEHINGKDVLVVGGGDSAVESAMILADNGNNVTLSYRREKFNRIKPGNLDRITEAEKSGEVKIILNSNVLKIEKDKVLMKIENDDSFTLANDLVYVFAGGELPREFLTKAGIKITKKFGEIVMSHK